MVTIREIQPRQSVASAGAAWSVVVPFFNEENYLAATLNSLKAQDLDGFRLILVDNASTDGSAAIAEGFRADNPGLWVDIVAETAPGQAAALKRGIALVETEFTAICDADTFYPPHYLRAADRLFTAGGGGTAAVLATGAPSASGLAHWAVRAKGLVVSRLLARQCHAGGYAQAFRTDALNAAGGYDRALWPYCLKDHELVHRVSKFGRLAYGWDFWCVASDRRADRGNVRWTLFERLLYHATPYRLKDWFFYEFLRPRFEARGLSELKLRERAWEERGP